MIRLSGSRTLDNYFIDENAVITDLDGNVQHQYLSNGRPCFKGQLVHKIQMWTNYGYRDGRKWVVHHKDENKLNNSLSNLIFMTCSEHMRLHSLNRSEETKRKYSESHKGNKNPNFGKHFSKEIRKKISEANKGKRFGAALPGLKWWNNGIKNIKAKECPNGFVNGRIKK